MTSNRPGQATRHDPPGRSSTANGLPVLVGVNVVHARYAARAPRWHLPRTGRIRPDQGTDPPW